MTSVNGVWYVSPEEDGLYDLVATHFGITPDEVRGRRLAELDVDSLDLVELVMELEEQFG